MTSNSKAARLRNRCASQENSSDSNASMAATLGPAVGNHQLFQGFLIFGSHNGHAFTKRVRAMGIRDRPIAARSPWQNGHVERLIGSIRRECIDHAVVFSEAHLRHILRAYAGYYNEARTHLFLRKKAPVARTVQCIGQITAMPLLGGLHHQYVRI
jgi:hypothetical protein